MSAMGITLVWPPPMRASGRWEHQRTAGRALGATCNGSGISLSSEFSRLSLTLNLLFFLIYSAVMPPPAQAEDRVAPVSEDRGPHC